MSNRAPWAIQVVKDVVLAFLGIAEFFAVMDILEPNKICKKFCSVEDIFAEGAFERVRVVDIARIGVSHVGCILCWDAKDVIGCFCEGIRKNIETMESPYYDTTDTVSKKLLLLYDMWKVGRSVEEMGKSQKILLYAFVAAEDSLAVRKWMYRQTSDEDDPINGNDAPEIGRSRAILKACFRLNKSEFFNSMAGLVSLHVECVDILIESGRSDLQEMELDNDTVYQPDWIVYGREKLEDWCKLLYEGDMTRLERDNFDVLEYGTVEVAKFYIDHGLLDEFFIQAALGSKHESDLHAVLIRIREKNLLVWKLLCRTRQFSRTMRKFPQYY